MDPIAGTDAKRKRRKEPFRRFFQNIPGVDAAIITSVEGLPIASALPRGIDETRIAAMTAALFGLAESSVIEMEKGKFEQLYIRGKDGTLFTLPAGPNAILTVAIKRNVRLSLIFLECRRAAVDIARLLSESYIPGDFDDENNICKYCGARLVRGQSVCHVCSNEVI